MEKVFRPKLFEIIMLFVLSILTFGGLIYYRINYHYPLLAFILVMAMSIYLFYKGILLKRSFILVSDQGIKGRIMRMEFELKWEDVVFLHGISPQNPPKNYSFIILGTHNENWELRVDSFDGKRIWEFIKNQVPLEALEPHAFKKTVTYRKWEEGQNRLIEEQIRVSAHWFHKITPWSILLLSAILTFIAWEGVKLYSPTLGFTIWFGIVGMLGCLILIGLSRSYILADKNEIEVFSLLSKYKIEWQEVKRVEYTPDHSAVAFYGSDKRLVVLLEACSISNRERFVQKVAQHAKQKNIEPKQVKSLPRTQLNTRLPKGESF